MLICYLCVCCTAKKHQHWFNVNIDIYLSETDILYTVTTSVFHC